MHASKVLCPIDMPERKASSTRTSEEDLSQTDLDVTDNDKRRHKRIASVYDAVAGRIGFNNFLSARQLEAGVTALKPEEVLLRRVDAPSGVTRQYYNADESLKPDCILPDAEVVTALHKYAADYYSAHAHGEPNHNYRSLDETALMAFGILLEEAAAEALGETADMVLVEPEGLDDGLPESAMENHQVKGRVKPPPTPDPVSSGGGSSSDDHTSGEERKAKRQRRKYAY